MVQCLIELRALCSTLDKYGLTPLDIAKEKGVIASTELLEERGAKTRVAHIKACQDEQNT
jgi:ankyrin repeat protein